MNDRARADVRLAWLIVGSSGIVTLTLVALLAVWAAGVLGRQMASRPRVVANAPSPSVEWPSYPAPAYVAPPVPPTGPPPPDTARPIGSPASWLGTDDYPSGALRRGEEGRVRVTLAVGRDGRPTGCSVWRRSGSDSLDNGTCLVLMANGRFAPAPNGPMVRRWTSPVVHWVLPHDAS